MERSVGLVVLVVLVMLVVLMIGIILVLQLDTETCPNAEGNEEAGH